MATNKQVEIERDKVETTSNDVLKREPSHDDARAAREFQEKRASGNNEEPLNSIEENQTEAKGNRR